jgi:hypothetical protein
VSEIGQGRDTPAYTRARVLLDRVF